MNPQPVTSEERLKEEIVELHKWWHSSAELGIDEAELRRHCSDTLAAHLGKPAALITQKAIDTCAKAVKNGADPADLAAELAIPQSSERTTMTGQITGATRKNIEAQMQAQVLHQLIGSWDENRHIQPGLRKIIYWRNKWLIWNDERGWEPVPDVPGNKEIINDWFNKAYAAEQVVINTTDKDGKPVEELMIPRESQPQPKDMKTLVDAGRTRAAAVPALQHAASSLGNVNLVTGADIDGVGFANGSIRKLRNGDKWSFTFQTGHNPEEFFANQRNYTYDDGPPLEGTADDRTREALRTIRDELPGCWKLFSNIAASEDKASKSEEQISHDKYMLLRRLLEMIGQFALDDNSNHKIWLLHGHGGAGKTTLMNFLVDILGGAEKALEANLLDLSDTFVRGELVSGDKSALIIGELTTKIGRSPKNLSDALSFLKKISGGDTVGGQIKHQQNIVHRRIAANVLAACNDMPYLPSGAKDRTAWMRRLMFVPYYSTPTQIDKDLPDTLRREMSRLVPLSVQVFASPGGAWQTGVYATTDECEELLNECLRNEFRWMSDFLESYTPSDENPPPSTDTGSGVVRLTVLKAIHAYHNDWKKTDERTAGRLRREVCDTFGGAMMDGRSAGMCRVTGERVKRDYWISGVQYKDEEDCARVVDEYQSKLDFK